MPRIYPPRSWRARLVWVDEEKKGTSYAELQGAIEGNFGEGSANIFTLADERGNARQNGRGKERNIKKVRKDDHGDLSSAEKRKFSLKNESADKVDVLLPDGRRAVLYQSPD